MMSYLSRSAFVCASGCDARDCLSLGICGQCGPITVTCYKDIESMIVDDVVGQSANHAEDGELSKVEESSSRKTAREKVSDYSWGAWQKSQHIGQVFSMVCFNHGFIGLREDERGKSGQKNRNTVQLVNSEACCRVAAVSPGQSCVENSAHGLLMGRNP